MVWIRRRSGEPKQPHRREAHSDEANDRRADLADDEEPDDDVENAERGMLRADRPGRVRHLQRPYKPPT
jgi:hypothetical protein